MFDLVIVGNFTVDTIYPNRIGNLISTFGGSPAYVSLSARQLGLSVAVISKVGKDFNEHIKWLETNGINLSGLKIVEDAQTTDFVLQYDGENRRLRLRNEAPPIRLEDISPSLSSKAIHVSPVANEIPLELIRKLRTLTNILSLDPQGFVRKFDKSGNMSLRKWQDSSILAEIDIYKSSLDEIQIISGLSDLRMSMKKISDVGIKIVIVTRGAEGSMLLFDNMFYEIPSYKPKKVKDYTGAGDVYIGGFLAEYVSGESPIWCACVGSAAASVKIESLGPTMLCGKEEIYQRASKIFKKV